MLTANIMGGLGNVLFQVSACMAAANRAGRPFAFVRTETTNPARPAHWSGFLSDLAPYIVDTIDCSPFREVVSVRDSGRYAPISAPDADALYILQGYFQCPRYFAAEFGDIAAALGIARRRAEVSRTFAPPPERDSVAMHFRIGDYAALQHVHPLLPYTYYRKSLTHIIERVGAPVDVYYFCEDCDIKSVEETVARLAAAVGDAARFVRGATDATPAPDQMLMMSLCDHNVIANSTFSWWSAFLNQSTTKVVCYPSIWFGSGHHDPAIADELFVGTDWTRITCA
jgi:hypothetical protein